MTCLLFYFRYVSNTSAVPLPTHFFVILMKCQNNSTTLNACSEDDLDILSFVLPHQPKTHNCIVSIIFFCICRSLYPTNSKTEILCMQGSYTGYSYPNVLNDEQIGWLNSLPILKYFKNATLDSMPISSRKPNNSSQ